MHGSMLKKHNIKIYMCMYKIYHMTCILPVLYARLRANETQYQTISLCTRYDTYTCFN
jgi:hypothetical protein